MSNLCALQDAKRYLGIETTNEDLLLTQLITAASGWVENYCNRTFLTGTYTDERIGKGETLYFFGNLPVTAVSSLAVDGAVIPQSVGPTASGWRIINSYSMRLIGYKLTDNSVIQCTYAAGYANLAALPLELVQAVIQIVALRFKERTWIGYKSKTLHTEVVSFTNADIPDDVKQTLIQYRRWMPI